MDRLDAAQLSWKIYGDPDGTTNGKVTPGYIWDTAPPSPSAWTAARAATT